MVRYVLHPPGPVPAAPAVHAQVVLRAHRPDAAATLEVSSADPRFEAEVRRRLRAALGYRGHRLGPWTTPRDLACAMATPALLDLSPRRSGPPLAPTFGPRAR